MSQLEGVLSSEQAAGTARKEISFTQVCLAREQTAGSQNDNMYE